MVHGAAVVLRLLAALKDASACDRRRCPLLLSHAAGDSSQLHGRLLLLLQHPWLLTGGSSR